MLCESAVRQYRRKRSDDNKGSSTHGAGNAAPHNGKSGKHGNTSGKHALWHATANEVSQRPQTGPVRLLSEHPGRHARAVDGGSPGLRLLLFVAFPGREVPVALWTRNAVHSCGHSRGFGVTPHRVPFSSPEREPSNQPYLRVRSGSISLFCYPQSVSEQLPSGFLAIFENAKKMLENLMPFLNWPVLILASARPSFNDGVHRTRLEVPPRRLSVRGDPATFYAAYG